MYKPLNTSGVVGDRLEALKELIQAPTSSGGFVERYFDPEIELPRLATPNFFVLAEKERIALALAIIVSANSFPQRVEADGRALERRRCRRVEHALRQSLGNWGKPPKLDLDEEIMRRRGAQLTWDDFIPEHLTVVHGRLRLVATWAIRNDEQRWGRSAVVNLENEIRWVRYAMRD